MSLDQQAAENLQVIRSLMERSTIYRAISAPTAFVGGITTLLFGFFGEEVISSFTQGTFLAPLTFFIVWGSVFAITVLTHLFQLYRDSTQNAEPIFSSRHWLAIRCMTPAMIIGGITTLVFGLEPLQDPAHHMNEFLQTTNTDLWIIFYGVALLSTQTFAPRSITLLGWLFFVTGLAGLATLVFYPRNPINANLLMILTFGLFHLIYALVVWKTSKKSTEAVNL